MINFEEFEKVELRTAKVLEAGRIDGSDKLLKLKLEAGDKNEAGEATIRQIIAGIGKAYEPDYLVGKTVIIIANLEPRQLMGMESNGMLLAAKDADGKPVFLMPEKDSPPGTRIG